MVAGQGENAHYVRVIEAAEKIGLGDQCALKFLFGNFERQTTGQVGLAVLFTYFDLDDARLVSSVCGVRITGLYLSSRPAALIGVGS